MVNLIQLMKILFCLDYNNSIKNKSFDCSYTATYLFNKLVEVK